MNRQLKILLLVFIVSVAGAAGLWWFERNKAQDEAEHTQTDIPAWQALPPEGDALSRITNEQQGFSAEAPAGWTATMVNSNLMQVGREDFSECRFFARLGSNDGYLSASALTEQLNPYGPKPEEKHRYAGTIEVGGWPAAAVTIFGHLEDISKEVDIPKGNILFIIEMKMKGLLIESNFEPHPRSQECDDAFGEFLKTIQII